MKSHDDRPRAWNSTLRVGRKPLERTPFKGPVGPTRKPRKGVKRSNPKRKAKRFAENYHSIARVQFVKSLPCCACGVVGYSENAHVGKASALGKKGPYWEIAPLCRNVPNPKWGPDMPDIAAFLPGCHFLQGTDKERATFWIRNKLDPHAIAAATEKAWQAFNGEQ